MTKPRARILVVDHDVEMLETCRRILVPHGYSVEAAVSAEGALLLLEDRTFDLLLVALGLPGLDGLSLAREASRRNGALAVILLTANATLTPPLHEVHEGVFDCLGTPLSALDLEVAVQRSLVARLLRDQHATLARPRERLFDSSQIVGGSATMQRVLDMVRKIADAEANILITGESGTGKELIARAIHANSRRRDRALVPLDCGALPDTLLESELFGAERGAYTGAAGRRAGLIEHADGGTLFLDEIDNLPLAMQAKLLRALEERTVRRLGGPRLIPCDVRLVTASNQDLWELVQQGGFRKDLYYRLNVVSILVPPLRERGGDVRLLAERFAVQLAARQCKPRVGFSAAALMLLERYSWPGNVRELRNAIERAVSLAESNEITPADLPPAIANGHEGSPGLGAFGEIVPANPTIADRPEASRVHGPFRAAKKRCVADFEVTYLHDLLQQSTGNISRAAVTAGLKRTALHRLLHQHGLDAKQFRPARRH